MKIFISGKITGEPIDQCYSKFKDAENYAKYICSVDAVNPLDIPGIVFGINHNDAMSICFNALRECDAIYMLSDWKNSAGAKMEHEKALEWGLDIIYQ